MISCYGAFIGYSPLNQLPTIFYHINLCGKPLCLEAVNSTDNNFDSLLFRDLEFLGCNQCSAVSRKLENAVTKPIRLNAHIVSGVNLLQRLPFDVSSNCYLLGASFHYFPAHLTVSKCH